MTEVDRIKVIMAGNAERECRACNWLGEEMDSTIWENNCAVGGKCPACGSDKIRDYESALYTAGYR
jgi:Zn finger protein HypA/HybF involved in hydrogenase expression